MPEPFFRLDGERFLSTEQTRGPWSADAQHGGPPAALLVREIERFVADGSPIARLTVEFLRPVPIAPLTVKTTLLRPGRKVRLVSASLFAPDGTEVCRAAALVLRQNPLVLPPLSTPPSLSPLPEASAPFVFPFFRWPVGYQTAVEIRLARGRFGEGAMAVWMRMRGPLVEGEEPSPAQRVAVSADSGNGISVALPVDRYLFINPDLTIHLHRLPGSAWIGLDATTTPEPNGIGLASCALFDERGAIGRSLQSLLVEARG